MSHHEILSTLGIPMSRPAVVGTDFVKHYDSDDSVFKVSRLRSYAPGIREIIPANGEEVDST